jgi:hypothetical protein
VRVVFEGTPDELSELTGYLTGAEPVPVAPPVADTPPTEAEVRAAQQAPFAVFSEAAAKAAEFEKAQEKPQPLTPECDKA